MPDQNLVSNRDSIPSCDDTDDNLTSGVATTNRASHANKASLLKSSHSDRTYKLSQV